MENTQHEPDRVDGSNAVLPPTHSLHLAEKMGEENIFLKKCFVDLFMFSLHVCVRITCMLGAHRGWKMALDPLELEL